jgi:hypothetical protein
MPPLYTSVTMTAPQGEIEPGLFPGLSDVQLAAQLQAYLDDGYVKSFGSTDADDGALAWAYYRAYKARAAQLANTPTSVNIPGEVSTTRTDGQREFFERAAARWLAVFDGFWPTGETSESLIPPSGTSKTHIGWGGTLRG